MSDSEEYLSGLRPAGLKLGLERMQALMGELGNPQQAYATIHIVGTNGKTSVARMAEAGLCALGVRAASSTSPHFRSWRERTSIDCEMIAEGDFEQAVEEVRAAVGRVEDRFDEGSLQEAGIEPGERMTQFEVATAVGFVGFRNAGVEAAMIEAGLGGRLDATNVIDSAATILTSIGLDHIEWLGDTHEDIAAEKLAVLRPGTILVLGNVGEEVRSLAARVAFDRGSRVRTPGALEPVRPIAEYQQSNLGLAIEAVRIAYREVRPEGVPALAECVERAAAATPAGRLEVLAGPPQTVLDVAHNVSGARALAEAVPAAVGSRQVIACFAMLADKDAAGILKTLRPLIREAVITEISAAATEATVRPGASGRPADELAQICEQLNVFAEAVPSLDEAVTRAVDRARELELPLLVTGSHHLVAAVRERLL